jgi:transcriptional regulator with XRE-family HTH domain
MGSLKPVSRQPLDLQRAQFLRSCRARIQPFDLGLPTPQRRRTVGLRREDVASLSGVSVAWYTWLEQGREMRVSDEVLERISHTFRLSGDERTYLFSLVQHRPPRMDGDATTGEMPPEVTRTISELPWPAIVTNLRWDVLAWNRLNTLLYRDYTQIPVERRNVIELIFTQPHSRDDAAMEDFARRILAKLRVDYSQIGEDRGFEAMIRRLEETSPLFHRLWHAPDIHLGSLGINRFTHPLHGELAFEHTSAMPDGHPQLRIVLCRPADEATRRTTERLNAERPA